MFTITKAPGNYTDSNLIVDATTGSDPSSEGVEIGPHRSLPHLARGYTTTSHFSRFTAPVQNWAARTVAVAGTAATLSPAAMAADQTVASFGAGHLALAFAAGSALTLGIQSLRARFAAVESPQAAARRADSDAELVALSAGEFTMRGANSDCDGEKSAHQGVLFTFYMMTEYALPAFFREFSPSHTSYEGFDGPDQPIFKADYKDELDFAVWMNKNWMNERCFLSAYLTLCIGHMVYPFIRRMNFFRRF